MTDINSTFEPAPTAAARQASYAESVRLSVAPMMDWIDSLY